MTQNRPAHRLHVFSHRPQHPFLSWSTRVAAVLALVCCTGCTTVPPYRPPALPAHAETGFDVASDLPVTQGSVPPQWWRLYRDPVLNSLVEKALRDNKSLAVAYAHVGHADALLGAAKTARLPTTEAGFGGTYGEQASDQIIADARGLNSSPRWGYEPSFSLSWEVDLWGRVRALVDSANAESEAARDLLDAARLSIVARTMQSYIEVCAYGQQADVDNRLLAISNQTANLMTLQQSAGLLSELPVNSSKALVENIRATLPLLEAKRRASLYELAVLTGDVPGDFSSAAAACRQVPHIEMPFPMGDGRRLLRRRPDLQAAERDVAAASARVGVATASLYPSITLGGSVDWLSSAGSLSSLGNQYAVEWGVGPLINWRFPNLGLAKAKVRQAQADNTAAIATFDAKVLNALKETQQALAIYGGEWGRYQSLIKASDMRARAVQIAKLQYAAGAITALDVLDAEHSLLDIEQEVSVSNAALAVDQVLLFKALGGGWQS